MHLRGNKTITRIYINDAKHKSKWVFPYKGMTNDNSGFTDTKKSDTDVLAIYSNSNWRIL